MVVFATPPFSYFLEVVIVSATFNMKRSQIFSVLQEK